MGILNRRDFIRLSPVVRGGAILACSKSEQLAGGTAGLSPGPIPMLAPGTFADTIFMNGKVVTMDASDTIAQAVAVKAGIPMTIGADAPCMPWYTAQMTLWATMARLPYSNKISFGREQRMTIQEALRAHTIGAAYAAHEEKIKGSLEPANSPM
jgi:predicted amidohydrolase YtcJ